LAKAASLGQFSDVPVYKIGAVLVFKKSVLATGYNQKKSHPLQLKYNKFREDYKRLGTFVHAEINCIGSLRSVPKGSTLFIGRFNANGVRSICRPCEGCLQLIKLHGITEIVYNTLDGYAIEHLKG